MKGYLYGQIANVGKFAVWWTAFSPLLLALFNGSTYSVGAARTSFNMAMFFLSPLAGVMAERWAVRRLLNLTTLLRGFLYAVLLPAAWLLLQSPWLLPKQDYYDQIFWVVFLILVFCDGSLVAFSNVVDIGTVCMWVGSWVGGWVGGCGWLGSLTACIFPCCCRCADCGGTSILAKQHGFAVDETILNKFNSLHTGWFDACMIVLSPTMAYFAVVAANNIAPTLTSQAQTNDIVGIMGVLAVVFFVASALSFYFYTRYIPATCVDLPEAATGDAMATGAGLEQRRTCCDEFEDVAANVWSGLKLCWGHTAVRWRLIFLGLETALEDAMISLVLMEFCISGVTGTQAVAKGGFQANVIIAVGKVGAVISAYIMNKYWAPPAPPTEGDMSSQLSAVELHRQQTAPFRPLFYCVFFGGLCPLLVPVALHLKTTGTDETLCLLLVYAAAFFFFLFSTVPKIGFATLMQTLAAQADASGRIFGFVAAFLTAMDSLVLMGMSALFANFDLQMALWISCGIIAVHGLVEVVFGPALVLAPQDPLQD